jgi:hypothetical protein
MAQYSEQVTPKTEENILVNFSRLLNFRFLLLSLNKTNKTKHQNNTEQTQLLINNISNNTLTELTKSKRKVFFKWTLCLLKNKERK